MLGKPKDKICLRFLLAVQTFLCPKADKKSALSTILDLEILQGHEVFLQRMMFDQQKINEERVDSSCRTHSYVYPFQFFRPLLTSDWLFTKLYTK